jgi:oligosaccharide repeat unit polymerase
MEWLFILVLICSCACLYLLSSRKLFDPAGLYGLHTVGLMIPPALVYAAGVELPLMGEFLYDKNGALLTLSAITALAFAGCIGGNLIFRRLPVGRFIFPAFAAPRSVYMSFAGVLVLAVLSLIVSLWPLRAAGFDIIRAADLSRHGDLFAGAAYLRQFQFFASLLSGGFVVYLLHRKKQGEIIPPWLLWGSILCMIPGICAGLVLGGKTAVVFPLAFSALAYEVCVARRGILRLIGIALAFAALVVALQFTRSEIVRGVDKPAAEHVYVGLYFITFDSTLVYLDTSGVEHHTETGQDFINGLAAIVPRVLWPDKPERHITLGSRFKSDLTHGQGQGGWPVYGFAQWYVNFGWLGVLIGGILTGWILALLQSRYAQCRDNPFDFVILCAIIFVVLGPWPGGLHSFFPAHYLLFIVPLFLYEWLTRRSLLNIP